jgi:VanZ family protein
MFRYLAWIFAIILMAGIFYLSSRSIEQSRGDSARFMTFLGLSNMDDAMDTSNNTAMLLHNAFRKHIHIIAFGLLGMLYFISLYGYFGGIIKTGIISLGLTVLYGITDEVHQIFTNRGASVCDVFLDALGGLIGITIVGLLFLLILNVKFLKKIFDKIYDFEPKRR